VSGMDKANRGWWRWRYLWMLVPFGPDIYNWLVRRTGKHELDPIEVTPSSGCVWCDLELCTPERHISSGEHER
jgi:hypothetical protein